MYLVVSVLCALTTGASSTLLAAQQASSSENSCVEIKDLVFELGAILYKGKLDKKGLEHLVACFHKDKIAELFSLSPDAFERLIDTKSLLEYCNLVLEKSYTHQAREKKALALKRSFHLEAWEEELECENLRPFFNNLTKLIYFSGTQHEKEDLIRKLRRAVTDLQSQNEDDDEPRKIDKYFDLQALKSIFDDLLRKKEVSEDRIVSVLNVETVLENISDGDESVFKYVHLKNFLTFIVTLIAADLAEEDPPLAPLLSCMRWDTLFIQLPELLGNSPRALQSLFSIPHLKRQIALLQEGAVTADGLRTIFKRNFVLTQERLELLINFDKLADGLNALRHGEQAHELKDIINFPLLEEIAGIDLRSAFNTELPESVHHKKLSELIDHFKNPKYLSVVASALPILWLAGHTFCHNLMETLEPQQWWTAGPLLVGAIMLVYQATVHFEEKQRLGAIVLKTGMVKAHRALAKLLPQKSREKEELLALAPSDPQKEPLYIAFIDLLTEEHLQTLEKPLEITNLFAKPRMFVAKHPEFIASICTHDKEHAQERIEIISTLLEGVVPFARLQHSEAIETFFDLLKPAVFRTLPHTGFAQLVRYCPHIVLDLNHKEYPFLQEASKFTLGEKSVISYLYDALAQAQDIHEIDLAQ